MRVPLLLSLFAFPGLAVGQLLGPERSDAAARVWEDSRSQAVIPSTFPPERRAVLEAAAETGDTAAMLELAGASGSLVDAFVLVQRAAEHGDPEGAYRLASRYALGIGTSKNPALALDWARKAAEKGHLKAAHALGWSLLETDDGRDEGLRWLEKAASAGSEPSALLLSAIYVQGTYGQAVDEAKAEAVVRPFAEKDFANSQVALASIYQFSKRHEADRTPAIGWLQRARKNGHPEAAAILERMGAPKPE